MRKTLIVLCLLLQACTESLTISSLSPGSPEERDFEGIDRARSIIASSSIGINEGVVRPVETFHTYAFGRFAETFPKLCKKTSRYSLCMASKAVRVDGARESFQGRLYTGFLLLPSGTDCRLLAMVNVQPPHDHKPENLVVDWRYPTAVPSQPKLNRSAVRVEGVAVDPAQVERLFLDTCLSMEAAAPE